MYYSFTGRRLADYLRWLALKSQIYNMMIAQVQCKYKYNENQPCLMRI